MQMPGEKGMDDMQALMANFRSNPPPELGGMKLARVRDYLNDTVTAAGGRPAPLDGPQRRPGDPRLRSRKATTWRCVPRARSPR